MSHYTKEDIIRIVEEEDVEKHGSNSQTVGLYFE